MPHGAGTQSWQVDAPLCQPVRYEVLPREIVMMAQGGVGIDLIARVLHTAAYTVGAAQHSHRTGQPAPRRTSMRLISPRALNADWLLARKPEKPITIACETLGAGRFHDHLTVDRTPHPQRQLCT